MKARLGDRNKAIELRRQGLSYKEIQSSIRVSKGLLSMWLSDLRLSTEEEKRLQNRLKERKNRGKLNSKISNQSRRLERERKTIKEAEVTFKKKKNDPLFLMGIVLFWAHGAKVSSDFNFMSKDTDMIFLMYAWAIRYLQVSKDQLSLRIFTRDSGQDLGIRGFWAKNLGINDTSIKISHLSAQAGENSPKIGHKNNPFDKGCVRITIVGVHYKRLMQAWQKLFIQYYGKALLSGN